MTRFVLSPAATADLEQIESFLDEQAPHATVAVMKSLRDTMRKLAKTPGLGHLRKDLTDEPLRFYSIWSYLLIYRTTRPVEFVRVLHGARDVSRELRRRR